MSNKEEDSFLNQILGITSDFMDRSSDNKQMKNCETDIDNNESKTKKDNS